MHFAGVLEVLEHVSDEKDHQIRAQRPRLPLYTYSIWSNSLAPIYLEYTKYQISLLYSPDGVSVRTRIRKSFYLVQRRKRQFRRGGGPTVLEEDRRVD